MPAVLVFKDGSYFVYDGKFKCLVVQRYTHVSERHRIYFCVVGDGTV